MNVLIRVMLLDRQTLARNILDKKKEHPMTGIRQHIFELYKCRRMLGNTNLEASRSKEVSVMHCLIFGIKASCFASLYHFLRLICVKPACITDLRGPQLQLMCHFFQYLCLQRFNISLSLVFDKPDMVAELKKRHCKWVTLFYSTAISNARLLHMK